jgi:hypothetical protein
MVLGSSLTTRPKATIGFDSAARLNAMGSEIATRPNVIECGLTVRPKTLKIFFVLFIFFLTFKKNIFIDPSWSADQYTSIKKLMYQSIYLFLYIYIYIKLTSTPLFLLKITQILWIINLQILWIINLHVFGREWVSTLYNWIHLITNGIKFGSLLLGVIISCLVWFLPIKTTKPNFYNSKKFKPKPVRTDRFRFSLVF